MCQHLELYHAESFAPYKLGKRVQEVRAARRIQGVADVEARDRSRGVAESIAPWLIDELDVAVEIDALNEVTDIVKDLAQLMLIGWMMWVVHLGHLGSPRGGFAGGNTEANNRFEIEQA